MNMVLKLFLSMSCSGALLILVLFFGKRFLKDKISRQWQYYIWLVVVIRLLFPFGAEINLTGKVYESVGQSVTRAAARMMEDPMPLGPEQEKEEQGTARPAEALAAADPFRDLLLLLSGHIWLVWLAVALGMLIRKVTFYQSFVQYIDSGSVPVSDLAVLDRLSVTAEQMGIKKPVELCINPQVSTPLLKGFFRPCIVLPDADLPEKDFQYIMLHELTHYKRRDMFYKWLVQITVCLHWFNPFVHLMGREITKACEFSCDEAVLAKTGYANAGDYGKTLLDAMAAVGKYKKSPGAVTLSENKEILKERLKAIMIYERSPKTVRILTGVLTLCIIFGALVLGTYPVVASPSRVPGEEKLPVPAPEEEDRPSSQGRKETYAGEDSSRAEQYYEAGSLPLFQIVFTRLDEKEQLAWLERFYADDDVSFFSVAVRGLDGNSSLFSGFAEKTYEDGKAGLFSILADFMDEAELEFWLDRALEEDRYGFQSILFDKLDRDGEKDAREKEWEERQMAEYQAVGVTHERKNYYYQGQLVNVFLDIRPNRSFYTLDMNPAGTVNIKVMRGEDGQITEVSCMDEEEVAELLGDMNDPDDFGLN